MSNDLLQLIGAWLANSWNVITSFVFPGTYISLAAILLGSCLGVISIRMIGKLFQTWSDGAQRGGNNDNIKISNDRRLDVR